MALLCLNLSAQTNADYRYIDNSAHLDQQLTGKIAKDEPGMVYAVILNGKVIKQGKCGVTDLETRRPLDFDTPFYIASIGKTFTSAAILILQQQGKLSISDHLGSYFPDLPSWKDKVTIEQLLNHTSGLPDHFDHFGEDSEMLDNTMVMDFLGQSELTFEPGTDYAYSNSAYVLLSEIVQMVSGQSFSRFLAREIFQPLNMNSTLVIEKGVEKPGNRAIGYVKGESGFSKSDYEGIYTLGAGGIYSTVNDLIKWDQALYDNEILNETSKKLAFTKAKVPGVRTYLAMGWMDESFGPKTTDFTGLSYVMAFGSLRGFRGRLMRFPDFGVSFISLSNSGNAHLWGEDFARAYFKKQ